jgi:hypothetical protein
MDENWSGNSFLLSFSSLPKPMVVSSVLLLFFYYLPTQQHPPSQAGCYYLGSKNNPFTFCTNYKPSTYLVITYFPTYLHVHICPSCYRMGYPGETRHQLSWGLHLLVGVRSVPLGSKCKNPRSRPIGGDIFKMRGYTWLLHHPGPLIFLECLHPWAFSRLYPAHLSSQSNSQKSNST